ENLPDLLVVTARDRRELTVAIQIEPGGAVRPADPPLGQRLVPGTPFVDEGAVVWSGTGPRGRRPHGREIMRRQPNDRQALLQRRRQQRLAPGDGMRPFDRRQPDLAFERRAPGEPLVSPVLPPLAGCDRDSGLATS